MNRNLAVDVIIPSYNGLPYVKDAIRSVLLQTHKPNRMIVVDDGSTDGTLEALGIFDGQIEVKVHHENQGLPAARNTGIQASAAPLVAFLDADDVWLPRKLERQVQEFAHAPSTGMVYSSVLDCDLELNPLGPPRKVKARKGEHVFNELYLQAFPMPPSTVMVRREVFERCGRFNETMLYTEDFECWLRIAMKYPISAIPEPLCLRRINPRSITATRGLERGIGYVFQAFDLCGAAAQRTGISLPLCVESRKRLFLRRSLRDAWLWNEPRSFQFFLSKLTGGQMCRLEEAITEALFLIRRLIALISTRSRSGQL